MNTTRVSRPIPIALTALVAFFSALAALAVSVSGGGVIDAALRERLAFWRGNVSALHRELLDAAAAAGSPAPSLRPRHPGPAWQMDER